MNNSFLTILNNRKPKVLDDYKLYAVNIILEKAPNNNYQIVFQKRSPLLKVQPGEISLAGGRVEQYETALDAALRESEEEFLIDSTNFQVLGEIDTLVTSYNIIIKPFVSLNTSSPIETFNENEVESLIKVPLTFFIENPPLRYDSTTYIKVGDDFPYNKIEDGQKYQFRQGSYPIYFYNYEGIIIWGLTAKIIKNFIDIIKGQI